MRPSRRILCSLLGMHKYRGWVAHVDGPCVFTSEVHNFRKCKHCPKMEHSFSTIQTEGLTWSDL